MSNEPNIAVLPPDGYSYDATVSLDLSNYDEEHPGVVEGNYAVYRITLERKYRIKDADDWNTFCSRLSDNDTYNRFSGETVYLENDITVSSSAGYSQHDFCGIFDGQGHTLTFNYNGSGSDKYVAPFSFVSVAKPAGSSEDDPDVPVTIKNLNVKSTIRNSGDHAAGLIGQCWGEVNVENCTMDIDIDTSKEYAAGYVGKNSAKLIISGGTVTAIGGQDGAGIGSGGYLEDYGGASCLDITITKDVILVTAIKGENAQAIGN